MDYFKQHQLERRKTGAGGWNCFCCDIQSCKHKIQRLNKQRVRRFARRRDKQLIKTFEV